eukprot:Amastigsp_a509910_164.p3 type:complete len:115 gc:universal Amastigsp_a509910_164:195-539(+)
MEPTLRDASFLSRTPACTTSSPQQSAAQTAMEQLQRALPSRRRPTGLLTKPRLRSKRGAFMAVQFPRQAWETSGFMLTGGTGARATRCSAPVSPWVSPSSSARSRIPLSLARRL